MKMKTSMTLAGLAGTLLLASACAVHGSDAATSAGDDALDTEGTVCSNGWCGTAQNPTVNKYGNAVSGSAVFTGAIGAKKQMGVCLLRRYLNSYNMPTVCDPAVDANTSASSCYPIVIGTGWSRHCRKSDGSSQFECFVRPGTRTDFCAGSPALGGAFVPPGTYTTPTQPTGAAYSEWVSDACFAGCSQSDPSTTSITVANTSAWCETHPDDPNCPLPPP